MGDLGLKRQAPPQSRVFKMTGKVILTVHVCTGLVHLHNKRFKGILKNMKIGGTIVSVIVA